MKKFVLFFGVCLGTSLLINGIFLVMRSFPLDTPEIAIEPNVVDFGKLPPNANLTREIQVKNKGTKIMHLLSAKVSCHCTSVRMEKTSLQPGESGIIYVSLDTNTLSRSQESGSYEVLLLSNDPRKPILPIIIKYAPLGSAWIEPHVLDFGRVDRSNLPVTLKFRLMRDTMLSSSEHLSSEKVTVTCDDNNIQLIPIENNKTEEKRNFSLVLKDNIPSGELLSNVNVFIDSNKSGSKTAKYQKSVLGYIRGNFFAKPKYLNISSVGEGYDITLFARDSKQAFDIETLSMSEELRDTFIVKIQKDDSEQNTAQIRLEFLENKNDYQEKRSGYLNVKCVSENDMSEIVRIPISFDP
jgi:hypothetical protein